MAFFGFHFRQMDSNQFGHISIRINGFPDAWTEWNTQPILDSIQVYGTRSIQAFTETTTLNLRMLSMYRPLSQKRW